MELSPTLRSHLDMLEVYFDDPDVSEILIAGPHQLFITKYGTPEEIDIELSESRIRSMVDRLMRALGGRGRSERVQVHSGVLGDGWRVVVVAVARGSGPSLIRMTREPSAEVDVRPDVDMELHKLAEGARSLVVTGPYAAPSSSILKKVVAVYAAHGRVVGIGTHSDDYDVAVHVPADGGVEAALAMGARVVAVPAPKPSIWADLFLSHRPFIAQIEAPDVPVALARLVAQCLAGDARLSRAAAEAMVAASLSGLVSVSESGEFRVVRTTRANAVPLASGPSAPAEPVAARRSPAVGRIGRAVVRPASKTGSHPSRGASSAESLRRHPVEKVRRMPRPMTPEFTGPSKATEVLFAEAPPSSEDFFAPETPREDTPIAREDTEDVVPFVEDEDDSQDGLLFGKTENLPVEEDEALSSQTPEVLEPDPSLMAEEVSAAAGRASSMVNAVEVSSGPVVEPPPMFSGGMNLDRFADDSDEEGDTQYGAQTPLREPVERLATMTIEPPSADDGGSLSRRPQVSPLADELDQDEADRVKNVTSTLPSVMVIEPDADEIEQEMLSASGSPALDVIDTRPRNLRDSTQTAHVDEMLSGDFDPGDPQMGVLPTVAQDSEEDPARTSMEGWDEESPSEVIPRPVLVNPGASRADRSSGRGAEAEPRSRRPRRPGAVDAESKPSSGLDDPTQRRPAEGRPRGRRRGARERS